MKAEIFTPVASTATPQSQWTGSTPMLGNMLNGRLRFALLRGTPNECLTYGVNPWEPREKFEEGVQLEESTPINP